MRFSTRDLLWLLTLAALVCGWGMDHLLMAKRWRGQQETFDQETRLLTEEMERLRTENALLERTKP